jgi:transposase-like protein
MLPITNLKQAYREIKRFRLSEWEGDYRLMAQKALKKIFEDRLHNAMDAYLEQARACDIADRRNGGYFRHLLTELGDIELRVPRTRTFSPVGIVREFARRTVHVERTILLAFVLGLATRKVSQALLPILGEPISPTTVSRIAKQLDDAVEAYHRRPLKDHYQVLILDGVVLKRKTGIGAQKRIILVALGIRSDGRKEIIDFQQARGESQAAWEGFLNSLYGRGLEGLALKLLITDGGKGLEAALPLVYGQIPLQRCWAHKTRNILNHVRQIDHTKVKKDLQAISHASNLVQAQKAARHFICRWQDLYPKATTCLRYNLSELLTFLRISIGLPHTALRTTNAIERRFREVKRRTRPMGVFSDQTSMDRILLSVFMFENQKEGTASPFLLLTQNS